MKIGQQARCIEPRMEGDVRGVIARERQLAGGVTGYILEVTHHNGVPIDESINPFIGPYAAEFFVPLDDVTAD